MRIANARTANAKQSLLSRIDSHCPTLRDQIRSPPPQGAEHQLTSPLTEISTTPESVATPLPSNSQLESPSSLPTSPQSDISDMPFCHVEQEGNKIPILSAGELTPSVWKDFRIACIQFFKAKAIPPERQVGYIGFQMKEPAMHSWYEADMEMYDTMAFDNFIEWLANQFLEKGWKGKIRREILVSTQGSGSFVTWANSLINKNALLSATDYFITEVQLRDLLEAHMLKDLHAKYDSEKIQAIEDFKEWCEAVADLDCERADVRREIKLEIARAVAEHTAQRPSTQKTNNPTTTVKTVTTNTMVPSTRRLPPLKDTERKLLQQYSGCFKCRKYNVCHRADACCDGPPNAATPPPILQIRSMSLLSPLRI